METSTAFENALAPADLRGLSYALSERAEPRRPFALSELWDGLVQGRLRLKMCFQSDTRLHAVAVRVDDPARRKPLSERHAKILKTWLLHGRSKQVAYDHGVSPSAMTALLKNALTRLGLHITPREVPSLLLLVAHATPGRPQAIACEHLTADEAQLLISIENFEPKQFGLSPAERDILPRLIAGRSNGALASERSVSPRTIANQLAHLFRKFGVSSRMELLIVLTRSHLQRLESRVAPRCS